MPQTKRRGEAGGLETTNSNSEYTREYLEGVLKERFGLSAFREGQWEVVCRLMRGQSAAAIFPTGGGKSLCYQLPAALLDGLTLVVSPLLALMREQVDFLKDRGLRAARLDSTLSPEQTRQVLQDLRQGKLQLLYVAPERFNNERFREMMRTVKVALFAVDEAHCISQWGHNFRPDYLKLSRVARQIQAERVLALTATATPAVLTDICSEFCISKEAAIETPFYRPNLTLRSTLCTEATRVQRLVQRLSSAEFLPAIVYVTLQKTAESVAERLGSMGLQARAYHAGLKDDQRQEIQDWFMQSQSAIVVATIAFGMGIDKSSIRSVLHYNPSKSIEGYAQEVGRAGRDGRAALCETLLVPGDRVVLENFAYADTPSDESIGQFVQTVAGQPEEFFISHYGLAYDTDIREGVIRVLMTYLELKGFIESLAPRYDLYKLKPKIDSAKILSHFEGERRQFAASVLAMTVRKKSHVELNLAHVVNRLGGDRSRIIKMLDYFVEQDWMELEVSGLQHGYRKLMPLSNGDHITGELITYMSERQAGELSRVNDLFNFLSARECQSMLLSKHFGQMAPGPCGHCGVCEGTVIDQLDDAQQGRIGDSALACIAKLKAQHPEVLASPRQQARFLCGLSSPALVRSRLSRDSAFGCCDSLSYQRVFEQLSHSSRRR
jgi:ATP-dependent DNA helicase RecQ